MSTTKRAFLDFYESNNIIPAKQDLSNLRQHYLRRRALYLYLGIVPKFLEGKDLIEFGPGPGDNAVYTASLNPRNYVLVDGNQASIDAIIKKHAKGAFGDVAIEIILSDMLNFKTDKRFDLVMAEAVIPGQINPEKYLTHIAPFVADGGALITTTNSYTSLLADMCRRLIKPFVVRDYADFNGQLKALIDFFKPDLQNLKGMSRYFEDWVLDTILQPWQGALFTIPEAIETMDQDFDVLGTSPKFASDWRWYKALTMENCGINTLVTEHYYRNGVMFLDYRIPAEGHTNIDSPSLEVACRKACDLHIQIWNSNDIDQIPEFLNEIREIAELVDPASPQTAISLNNYIHGMEEMIRGNKYPDFGTFRTLFGRGQQYLSFIRRL